MRKRARLAMSMFQPSKTPQLPQQTPVQAPQLAVREVFEQTGDTGVQKKIQLKLPSDVGGAMPTIPHIPPQPPIQQPFQQPVPQYLPSGGFDYTLAYLCMTTDICQVSIFKVFNLALEINVLY